MRDAAAAALGLTSGAAAAGSGGPTVAPLGQRVGAPAMAADAHSAPRPLKYAQVPAVGNLQGRELG